MTDPPADAVTATAQAFDPASVLGTLDDVDPLFEDDLPALYSRQLALTARRVRVLSAQLAQAFAEHKQAALVREDFIFDRETGTPVSAGESITALAELEGKERDRLDRQLATALRLRALERESAERRAEFGRRVGTLAQELCERAGLDWAAEGTRQIAAAAVVRAFGRSNAGG